jgi:hypothetical protein
MRQLDPLPRWPGGTGDPEATNGASALGNPELRPGGEAVGAFYPMTEPANGRGTGLHPADQIAG